MPNTTGEPDAALNPPKWICAIDSTTSKKKKERRKTETMPNIVRSVFSFIQLLFGCFRSSMCHKMRGKNKLKGVCGWPKASYCGSWEQKTVSISIYKFLGEQEFLNLIRGSIHQSFTLRILTTVCATHFCDCKINAWCFRVAVSV